MTILKIISASVLFFLAQFTLSAQQTLPGFGSAEERIVYNKQQQLPKYQGVHIQYNYKLLNFQEARVQQLIAAAQQHFLHVQSVELAEIDGIFYIQILTEGDRINHEKQDEFYLLHSSDVQKDSRKYWLAP